MTKVQSPVQSVLGISILCQLMTEPQSGYSLKKTFRDTPMGHFSSSPGAIYPALQRMEKSGWITGQLENAESLRARRVYQISDDGIAVLKASFQVPVTREMIIHNMDLLLLRFAFMTPLLGRTAAQTFLEDLIPLLGAYVEELSESAKQFANAPLEGVLALRHGIESYKTHHKWAQMALGELKSSTTNEIEK